MVWKSRQVTYRGDSTLYLTPEEVAGYYLNVYLQLKSWPIQVYSNDEYRPSRTVYGRLVKSHRGVRGPNAPSGGGLANAVMGDELIRYPTTLLVRHHDSFTQTVALVSRLVGEATRELGSGTFPIGPEQVIQFLFNVQTTAGLLSEIFPAPSYAPSEFRLATHPDSVWCWTVVYFERQFGQAESADPPQDPGEGGGAGGGDGSSGPFGEYEIPGGENIPMEFPGVVDTVDDGFPSEDFSQEPGELPSEQGVFGENYWVRIFVETTNPNFPPQITLGQPQPGRIGPIKSRLAGGGTITYSIETGSGANEVNFLTSADTTPTGFTIFDVNEFPSGPP